MPQNQDQDAFIFFLLVLFGVCIWLYIKLKKEKKLRDAVSKENAKLIADNALLLNEHLKFQLQPHTLNNILANLKVFSNKLNKGLDSLSATPEYILYRGNHHLVRVHNLDGLCKDHNIRWSFLSTHKHGSGELIDVCHVGCNLSVK